MIPETKSSLCTCYIHDTVATYDTKKVFSLARVQLIVVDQCGLTAVATVVTMTLYGMVCIHMLIK